MSAVPVPDPARRDRGQRERVLLAGDLPSPMPASSARCERTAPFGGPVVPLVYMISAACPGFGSGCRLSEPRLRSTWRILISAAGSGPVASSSVAPESLRMCARSRGPESGWQRDDRGAGAYRPDDGHHGLGTRGRVHRHDLFVADVVVGDRARTGEQPFRRERDRTDPDRFVSHRGGPGRTGQQTHALKLRRTGDGHSRQHEPGGDQIATAHLGECRAAVQAGAVDQQVSGELPRRRIDGQPGVSKPSHRWVSGFQAL